MPAFFAAAAVHLGAVPGLALESDVPGVVVTSTSSPLGDRMLHLLNPTGNVATVTVREDGEPFGGGVMLVPAHTGHFLPWGLTFPWGRIVSSTAEVVGVEPDEVTFGAPVGGTTARAHHRLVLDVDEHLRVGVEPVPEASVDRRGRRVTVDAYGPGGLTLRLSPQLPTA